MVVEMSKGGDKTYEHLEQWKGSQKDSERLSAQLMAIEGYESIDPSHPLGGPDGAKDALAKMNGELWIMAVGFNRDTINFSGIKKKLINDLKGLNKNKAVGIAFFTNQKLTITEREKLKVEVPQGNKIEIYHLERISHLLNKPECYGIRLEYLGLKMSKPEQLSFIATIEKKRNHQIIEELQNQNNYLKNLITGGNTTITFDLLPSLENNKFVLMIIIRGNYPVYDVEIEVEHNTQKKEAFELLSENNIQIEQLEIESNKYNQRFQFAMLRPEKQTLLQIDIPPNKQEYEIEISATSRNGQFFYKFELQQNDNGKLLFQRTKSGTFIDPDKPNHRSNEGHLLAFPDRYNDYKPPK